MLPRRDITAKLLKATLNPNKQQSLIVFRADSEDSGQSLCLAHVSFCLFYLAPVHFIHFSL